MASEPTSAEKSLLVDMVSLAGWCKISSQAPTAPSGKGQQAQVSDVQTLCAFMQAAPDEHYRSIAMLAPADWSTATAGITFNGQPPSIALRGKIAFFHMTARRLCNLEPWPQIAAPAPAPSGLPPALPQSAQALQASTRVNLPVINIGKVLDQRMSDDVTFLDANDILTYNANYIRVMEVPPPTTKAVTREQLTALDFTLKNERPPYADLAIFGKHGTQGALAMAFTGLITAPGGTMHTVEILGPPNLDELK